MTRPSASLNWYEPGLSGMVPAGGRAKATRQLSPSPRPTVRMPMWLSHHYPEDYDRCVRVGNRYICRRCLVLYPVAFLAMALALAGARWPKSLDSVLLVVLPLPAVAEFVLEHLGAIGYRPRFQAAVTVPLGVALGVGFE